MFLNKELKSIEEIIQIINNTFNEPFPKKL